MDLPIKILNFDCETLPLFAPFTISSICDAADVFFVVAPDFRGIFKLGVLFLIGHFSTFNLALWRNFL